MGGHSNLEGRVEVCVDGRWETISDDGWGVNEATVVCRQLRYNTTGRWLLVGSSTSFRQIIFIEVPVSKPYVCIAGNLAVVYVVF